MVRSNFPTILKLIVAMKLFPFLHKMAEFHAKFSIGFLLLQYLCAFIIAYSAICVTNSNAMTF